MEENMKKINDLEITAIVWNPRSIQISWHSASGQLEAVSCLYQHSDGTWAVDPYTKSLGSVFGEKLLTAVMKDFISRSFPYDDASSFAGGDVDRVTGILKKEEMYRRQLRKTAAAAAKQNKNQRIDVWFADSCKPSKTYDNSV